MVSRYTGQWARSQLLPQDPTPEQSTKKYRFPDPGHGSFSESSAPLLMDSPQIPEVIDNQLGDVLWEGYAIQQPANVYMPSSSTNPKAKNAGETGHGVGGPRGPIIDSDGKYNVHSSNQILGAARGADRGAARQYGSDNYSYGPHGLMHHEHPLHVVSPTMADTPITSGDGDHHAQLRRGYSSDRINRGVAGRSGQWRRSQDLGLGPSTGGPPGNWDVADKPAAFRADRIDREFWDARFVQGQLKYSASRTVTPQVNIPPPENATRYNSPFGSLQRFMPHYNLPLSGIKRTPSPWYEEKLTEFTPVETGSDWGYSTVVP